jgi:hypothetical protein
MTFKTTSLLKAFVLINGLHAALGRLCRFIWQDCERLPASSALCIQDLSIPITGRWARRILRGFSTEKHDSFRHPHRIPIFRKKTHPSLLARRGHCNRNHSDTSTTRSRLEASTLSIRQLVPLIIFSCLCFPKSPRAHH